jgi:Immunity protein family (Imm11)
MTTVIDMGVRSSNSFDMNFQMITSSDFRLMVQSGFGLSLKGNGPIGARPDISIVNGSFDCARYALPRSLDRLTFTFPVFVEGNGRRREIIQNFYYMNDFFVVATDLRDFLVGRLPNALDVARVHVRHQDGTPASDTFFAVKVTRTIDCIDAHSSLHKSWPDEPKPFAEKSRAMI